MRLNQHQELYLQFPIIINEFLFKLKSNKEKLKEEKHKELIKINSKIQQSLNKAVSEEQSLLIKLKRYETKSYKTLERKITSVDPVSETKKPNKTQKKPIPNFFNIEDISNIEEDKTIIDCLRSANNYMELFNDVKFEIKKIKKFFSEEKVKKIGSHIFHPIYNKQPLLSPSSYQDSYTPCEELIRINEDLENFYYDILIYLFNLRWISEQKERNLQQYDLETMAESLKNFFEANSQLKLHKYIEKIICKPIVASKKCEINEHLLCKLPFAITLILCNNAFLENILQFEETSSNHQFLNIIFSGLPSWSEFFLNILNTSCLHADLLCSAFHAHNNNEPTPFYKLTIQASEPGSKIKHLLKKFPKIVDKKDTIENSNNLFETFTEEKVNKNYEKVKFVWQKMRNFSFRSCCYLFICRPCKKSNTPTINHPIPSPKRLN